MWSSKSCKSTLALVGSISYILSQPVSFPSVFFQGPASVPAPALIASIPLGSAGCSQHPWQKALDSHSWACTVHLNRTPQTLQECVCPRLTVLKRKMATSQIKPRNRFLTAEYKRSTNICSSAEKPCSGNGSSQCQACHCQELPRGTKTLPRWDRAASLPDAVSSLWGGWQHGAQRTGTRRGSAGTSLAACGLTLVGSSIDAFKTSHMRGVQLGGAVLATHISSGVGVHLSQGIEMDAIRIF